MTRSDRFDNEAAARRHAIRHARLNRLLGVGLIVGLIWFLLGYKMVRSPDEIALLAGIGVAVFVAGVIWAWWLIRHDTYFLRHGVPVTGVITRVVIHEENSGTGIDVEYEYDGKRYDYSFSQLPTSYGRGKPISLLVDPRDPTRCVQKEYLYPAGQPK